MKLETNMDEVLGDDTMQDRKWQLNSAALAIHKSIIGIVKLEKLEDAASDNLLSGFGDVRAIYTYYCVYHLFVACMLMDYENTKDILGKSKEKYFKTLISDNELNRMNEIPEEWEKKKAQERDWATVISHTQVKKYCEILRGKKDSIDSWLPYLIPLYDNFVDDTIECGKCKPALYEKLCYIRDRIIYRPSYVITKSENRLQTSRDLGKEIRSLPKALDLFQIVSDIYDGFLKVYQKEEEKNKGNSWGECGLLLRFMWIANLVSCWIEDYMELGHKMDELKEIMLFQENDEKMYFSSYIAQLLETEKIENIIKYNKKYWIPLRKKYPESELVWK